MRVREFLFKSFHIEGLRNNSDAHMSSLGYQRSQSYRIAGDISCSRLRDSGTPFSRSKSSSSSRAFRLRFIQASGVIPAMWEPGTGYWPCFVSGSRIHAQRSKTCTDAFSWFQPVELMNGIKREHSLICKGPVEVLVLDREVKFQPWLRQHFICWPRVLIWLVANQSVYTVM